VQDLLDHKHITSTQIYDNRRRAAKDSASHNTDLSAAGGLFRFVESLSL
jgi:hypothetical protein